MRLESVDVLLELPGKPRLADSGLAVEHDEAGPLGLVCGVEQLLDQPDLAFTADQRRLESVNALAAAEVGHHRSGLPQPRRLGFALEPMLTNVHIGNGRCGQCARRVVDPDRSRLRDRLHARRGVHRVAGDHSLGRRTDGDRDLTGDDADPHREAGNTDPLTERLDRFDQFKARTHRPLRVVLVRERHTPDRHHRVTDELLDDAAVAADNRAALAEVARQQLANIFGVASLRQRREAREVTEQHRRHATLGDWGCRVEQGSLPASTSHRSCRKSGRPRRQPRTMGTT